MVQIEVSRRVVDRVNEKCPDSYQIGRLSGSRERIAKKRLAKAFAMLAFVHRQAGEQNDAYRVIGETSSNSFRRFIL